MAIPAAFFAATPRLTDTASGDSLVFDCSVNESHRVETQWTAEPLEDGSLLSESRIVLQRRIPMTVIISSANRGGLFPTRHIDAWTRLVSLATQDPPPLFEVVTAIETYTGCVLKTVGTTRTPDQGNSLVADVELLQLRFSATDVAANLADAAQDPGLGEVDLGSQGLG